MESFERIEQVFFKKILKAHIKTPIESIYLELGVIPLRFQLMKKRVLYYHCIMQRSDGEITKQLVCVQKNDYFEGDFYAQTKQDLETLSISDEELNKSTGAFKDIVVKRANDAAFNFLITRANEHSKVNATLYTSCNGTGYFCDQRFSPDLANLLFQFRTRGVLVKNNFRNNYRNTNILCPLCELEDDTQEHLFECVKLRHIPSEECNYEDIFSDNNNVLLNVTINLKKIVEWRRTLLNPEE